MSLQSLLGAYDPGSTPSDQMERRLAGDGVLSGAPEDERPTLHLDLSQLGPLCNQARKSNDEARSYLKTSATPNPTRYR